MCNADSVLLVYELTELFQRKIMSSSSVVQKCDILRHVEHFGDVHELVLYKLVGVVGSYQQPGRSVSQTGTFNHSVTFWYNQSLAEYIVEILHKPS